MERDKNSDFFMKLPNRFVCAPKRKKKTVIQLCLQFEMNNIQYYHINIFNCYIHNKKDQKKYKK